MILFNWAVILILNIFYISTSTNIVTDVLVIAGLPQSHVNTTPQIDDSESIKAAGSITGVAFDMELSLM